MHFFHWYSTYIYMYINIYIYLYVDGILRFSKLVFHFSFMYRHLYKWNKFFRILLGEHLYAKRDMQIDRIESWIDFLNKEKFDCFLDIHIAIFPAISVSEYACQTTHWFKLLIAHCPSLIWSPWLLFWNFLLSYYLWQ